MNEFPDDTSAKKPSKKPAKKLAVKVPAEMVDALSAWDGVPLPQGELKARMEHIDAALQRIRKRDRGGMTLPSAQSLGQELGVSDRTVRETIRTMKDLYAMPIEYNPSRHGFEYTEDVVYSPFMQLSESELVAMYLAQNVGAFKNTAFQRRLKSAFGKMVGLFGGKLSFDPELLDECFSFDSDGPRARFKPEHLDVCTRAILHREELVLNYTKQHGEGAGIPELRRVQPLHLTYRDFAYYVLCNDYKSSEERLFMVTRMNSVEQTGKQFARPKKFHARAHLEKAFKIFTSKETVKVVLNFAPAAIGRVTERTWHSTQKFRDLENGWLEMSMDVGLAPDLYSWIGGFFGQCRVVETEKLREKMRQLYREGIEVLG